MPVNSTHHQYGANIERWQRIRDVIAGEDFVKLRASTYLRMPPAMSLAERVEYAKAASFLPATARTVDGLTGAIFRKAPRIEIPGRASTLLENADAKETPFVSFAKSLAREVVSVGRVGVLVDVPSGGGDPYLSWYPAESIINWRTQTVDGRPQLVMVVLKETVETTKRGDRFETEMTEQFRVIELTRVDGRAAPVAVVSLFQRSGVMRSEFVLVQGPTILSRRGQPLEFLPFTFLGPTSLDPGIEQSPILGLVDVNLSHFRSSAELENSLWFCGYPIFVVAGRFADSDDNLEITAGSGAIWQLEQDGKATVLQGSAENVGALSEALDRKQKQMAVLGARLLEPQKSGVESAETVGLRHRGENSFLASIADTMGRGLSRALSIGAWWMGGIEGRPEGLATVQLNRDFTEASMSADQILKLITAWHTGGVGSKVVHHVLSRGEVLPENMDFDKFVEDVEANGPDSVMFRDQGSADDGQVA